MSETPAGVLLDAVLEHIGHYQDNKNKLRILSQIFLKRQGYQHGNQHGKARRETQRDFLRGGPVGLETLSATIGEDTTTIEDVYEPYLIQLGFIARTPRGRVCLSGAYKHLGFKVPPSKEAFLEQIEKTADLSDNEDK